MRTTEGFFLRKKDTSAAETDIKSTSIKLLAKDADLEIMSQRILQGATVWLTPADDSETMEYFFVHQGALEITLNGEVCQFGPGDSFYASGLKEDVLIKAREDTLVIYIANRPMFAYLLDYEKDRIRLLEQIDEKDHYTHQHSRNVMEYSVRLYEALKEKGIKSDLPMDDMIIAALFHDIGKCYVPDEILKKQGPLTPGEMRAIYRHPIDSARLLRPNFNERIAEIAANHHERLDGSGYPYGLTGDQISFEAKVLAVTDCFDAMTTNRGYNRIKGYTESAEELCSMPDKFDSRITGALRELVENGTLFNDMNARNDGRKIDDKG